LPLEYAQKRIAIGRKIHKQNKGKGTKWTQRQSTISS
jgi:hypothetical protein